MHPESHTCECPQLWPSSQSVKYSRSRVWSWYTGWAPFSTHRTCTHHKKMNSASNLWKTQKWIRASRPLLTRPASLDPGLLSRDQAETGALGEGERHVEAHFCFVLFRFQGDCHLLVYSFSSILKGRAGIKPSCGRPPPPGGVWAYRRGPASQHQRHAACPGRPSHFIHTVPVQGVDELLNLSQATDTTDYTPETTTNNKPRNRLSWLLCTPLNTL